MLKKWWIIALVFALALSLTSCAQRMPSGPISNYGYNLCDGSMGQFNIYTVMTPGLPGIFTIHVIPVALQTPGDIVSITVANQGSRAYRQLVSEVVVNVDQDISAGQLTQDELNQYNLIVITTFIPGINFLQANPQKDAICGLPLLGDGVSGMNPPQ